MKKRAIFRVPSSDQFGSNPKMLRNQLAYVSDALFTRALQFCERHPGVATEAQMLQKLTIFDFVAPALPRGADVSILEIGSGLGIHSALLSHHGRVSSTELETPGSFVGADQPVQRARQLVFQELGSGAVDFRYHDGKRFPFEDHSFDVVFHNSVIEHVPDIAAFNAEVRRMLKSGGLCICITGAPALCRFRLAKHYAKLPVRVMIALAKEIVPRAWLRRLIAPLTRAAGASTALSEKIVERLTRVDQRLAQVAPSAAGRGESPDLNIRAMYARLFHFIYFPVYNRIVVEKAAQEYRTSADALLRSASLHFQRARNRLAFELTPVTHGQHYRDVWEEMEEWRVERWRELFVTSGFVVESAYGYRYHHRLEITPSAKWNSLRYLHAAKRIHRDIASGRADPSEASEFVLLARSSAT